MCSRALLSRFAVLNVAIAGTTDAHRFYAVLICIEFTGWIADDVLYRELKSAGRQNALLERHRFCALLPGRRVPFGERVVCGCLTTEVPECIVDKPDIVV